MPWSRWLPCRRRSSASCPGAGCSISSRSTRIALRRWLPPAPDPTARPMASPTLGRLVERAALQALVDTAARLEPGLTVRVLDLDGSVLAATGRTDGAGDARATGDTGDAGPEGEHPGRPIVVGGRVLGTVVAQPGAGGPHLGGVSAVAELAGQAIELAAQAGLDRR